MSTDDAIRSFFGSAAPRAAELAKQYRAGWPASFAGGAIGCLVPMALMVVLIANGNEWKRLPWFQPAAIGAGVVALACAVLGSLLYRSAQRTFEPVDARVDDELLRPFVALLVDGGTLAFPDESIREWRPSLLFPKLAHIHAAEGKTNRVTGRIGGLPAVLDELVIRFRNDSDATTFSGWIVRLELPFAVGGHLRIRRTSLACDALVGEDDFERLEGEEARLATGHRIDAAAPGAALELTDGPAPSGLPSTVVLTEGLIGALRAAPKLELAVSGRTLWIAARGPRAFDNRVNVAWFDADYGLRTAARMRAVEAVARAVADARG